MLAPSLYSPTVCEPRHHIAEQTHNDLLLSVRLVELREERHARLIYFQGLKVLEFDNFRAHTAFGCVGKVMWKENLGAQAPGSTAQ